MQLRSTQLNASVLDALTSQICVLDRGGRIVAVNRSWRKFGAENDAEPSRSDVGTDYVEICKGARGPGADEAGDFAKGIQAVLEGKTDLFQMEYPCHSPAKSRWFLGRVTPLDGHDGAVISHLDITDRKLLEFELARLASTDSLTGLPNRRYFLDVANREVERTRRFSVPASVIMIDLDHFKDVNDTYGHATGDEVLRSACRTLRKSLREIDVLARLGGEEFVVMLPETNSEGALSAAEKLRGSLSNGTIDSGHNEIKLTASFGVAQVSSDDQSVEEVLDRADSALYEAKHSGRNCVRVFGFVDLDGS
jgi:diguanylate cyclase (GGDEF)-like protein